MYEVTDKYIKAINYADIKMKTWDANEMWYYLEGVLNCALYDDDINNDDYAKIEKERDKVMNKYHKGERK